MYGPYEANTRLIPTLIKNLLINKLPNLVDSKISRDMIYIKDVVDLFITIATKKVDFGEIYNMGSGKNYSLKEIFETVQSLLNSNFLRRSVKLCSLMQASSK